MGSIFCGDYDDLNKPSGDSVAKSAAISFNLQQQLELQQEKIAELHRIIAHLERENDEMKDILENYSEEKLPANYMRPNRCGRPH